MSYSSAWQFIRQDAVFVGVFVSGLLLLGLLLLRHRSRRINGRKKQMQALVACWCAVLFELSLALDCMQETTRHLIRNRQRLPRLERFCRSDIFLHQWLREGFLQRASDREGACLVKVLSQELHLFIWNVDQAANTRQRMLGMTSASRVNRSELQKTTEAFDDAAIRLACNRHHGMVDAWKQSVALLRDFCSRNEFEGGNDLVTPSVIPLEWQMGDTKSWTVTDLALVGEDKWEP